MYYKDHRIELYDLEKDIGESTDLAKSIPEKDEELRSELTEWLKETGATDWKEAAEAR